MGNVMRTQFDRLLIAPFDQNLTRLEGRNLTLELLITKDYNHFISQMFLKTHIFVVDRLEAKN